MSRRALVAPVRRWAIVPDVSEPFSAPSVVRQLDNCTFCPKMCRHACPVSTASGRETHIPQAKMDQLNQLRLGHTEWTQESTNSLWAYTGCRHCTMYCDHENEPGMVLFVGRAEAVQRGAAPAVLSRFLCRLGFTYKKSADGVGMRTR